MSDCINVAYARNHSGVQVTYRTDSIIWGPYFPNPRPTDKEKAKAQICCDIVNAEHPESDCVVLERQQAYQAVPLNDERCDSTLDRMSFDSDKYAALTCARSLNKLAKGTRFSVMRFFSEDIGSWWDIFNCLDPIDLFTADHFFVMKLK